MIEHFFFAMNLIALVFFLAGASYFYKEHRFERKDFIGTTKLLTAGIILLAVSIMVDLIQGLQNYFDINYFFQRLGMKAIDLVYINELAFLPLAGISFLMAMILLKKHI